MSTFIEYNCVVIAPNRHRRDFDPAKLNELRESIETLGLLHAIVLREEENKMILVAGERRWRAIGDLYDLGGTFRYDDEDVPNGCIPYVNLGELSEIDRESAELEENIRRDDLTWQEQASATARLARLRAKQAAAAHLPDPSHVDLAEEITGQRVGQGRETIRRELIVAQHLDNPEVAAAKNVDEAFKVLKKQESVKKNQEIAERIGRVFTADAHKLFNEDAVGWLAQCPEGQYDCILTDPPYGMGADEFGDSGGNAAGAHGYADDDATFRRCLDALVLASMRITKPQAHLYVFCDLDRFTAMRAQFEAAGWWVHRTPLIWFKPNGNRVPWPQNGPQRKWEMILYAVKGKRPVNTIGPDLIECSSDANLGHAAQKPVKHLLDLLRRSVRPGDSVLDPFMGSGGIVEAAHELKVSATGVEIDPSAFGIAISRYERLRAQLSLDLELGL